MGGSAQQAILVTGGAGYVGSHACKALAKAGYLPVTYDSLEQGRRDLVKWGPLEVGNIQDPVRLTEVIQMWKPIAVMHFAGLIAVGDSVRDPISFYQSNVSGTFQLLDVMIKQGVGIFVFSSSAAVYGDPVSSPIGEASPTHPVNPYGRSKLMIEQALADAERAYGLKWLALRYFNACGADADGESGECHDPETHLIPRALMAAAGDIPHLDVFGTDYPTPDGTCIRDYVHVSDLADWHVAALESLKAGQASAALNLGTGQGASVSEIITTVERITGLKVPVHYGPRRDGDAIALVADPCQALARFKRKPNHSDLETIVATAWNWYKSLRSL
jgi:UDP-arabinose 4-epimerase